MNSTGRTILLLHGALGCSDQFDHWIPLLESEFRVERFDFNGHRYSTESDQFGMPEFAQQINSFLESKDLQQVDIFGYSMGGYAAIKAALSTSRIHSIRTYGTKFDWRPETAERETRMLDPDRMLEKVPAFAAQLEARHSGIGWRNLLGRTAEMMNALGMGGALTASQLQQLSIPVRIGWGTEDRMVGKPESEWAASCIPGAEFVEFERYPHPLEQLPADRMVDWLSK